MCDWIKNLFHKQKFAYPEQSKGQDIFTNVNDLKVAWCAKYCVEELLWGLSLNVVIDNTIKTPAHTISGIIYIQSQWLNIGVLAHEAAHISYSLLDDKKGFEIVFNYLSDNPKIKLLRDMGKLSTIIENYAEIYRYWGNQMPESLIKYYPKLL